ncbi:hypothetical protein NQZ68_014468 [Dissostichus eleginoides]|nr:hypothetical protein NQZ68_014468 [Dissostichus eleginoides]
MEKIIRRNVWGALKRSGPRDWPMGARPAERRANFFLMNSAACSTMHKKAMWRASEDRQHVFVDLVVTQQGLRLEVGVGRRKRLKREVAGGLKWLPAPHISHRGVLQR